MLGGGTGITPIYGYEDLAGGGGGGASYALEVFAFERTTDFPSGFSVTLPFVPQGEVILELEGYAMTQAVDFSVSGTTLNILKTETDISQYEDGKLRFRATFLRQI